MKERITEEQFAMKYELYKSLVFHMALSYVKSVEEAENILQDVFLAYYQKFDDYENPSHEKNYLVRFAIRKSIDYLRKEKTKKNYLSKYQEEDTYEMPSSSYSQEEEDIWNYVLQLPNKIKEVFVLYYYEEESIADIAKDLSLSESAIKKRLERGRKIIKEKYYGHEQEAE